MKKTYIIKNSNFKVLSKGKGLIDFFLIDETGEKRTVSATAKLGWNDKIKSIIPIYKRETPIVEVLAKASVNDRIDVDFTGFNNKNPRTAKNRTVKTSKNSKKTILQTQTELLAADKPSISQVLSSSFSNIRRSKASQK